MGKAMLIGKEGLGFDRERQNWDGSGARPIHWSVWCPTDVATSTSVPDRFSGFKKEDVIRGAPLAQSGKSFPLVLLSHGSGADGAAMEWLAHRLAARGCVALALNHHGHTVGEYRPQGFLCLWERARDMSAILNHSAWREALRGSIDDYADVAGFSAGAYTALLLMGARVEYSQFEPDNPTKSPVKGPREFPNLIEELPKLYQNKIFLDSWENRRGNFSDSRFRRAVAIAPGRSVMGFCAESLKDITKPVQLFAGNADTVSPRECCEWLHSHLSDCALDVIRGGVGHYTFLPEGSDLGHQAAPELFRDNSGIERSIIHDYVARRTADFLKL